MKKLSCFVICLILAAMLTGCGAKSGNEPAGTTAGAEIQTQAQTTVTETTTTEATTPETTTEETTTAEPVPEGNRNNLTGLYDLADEAVGKRPVAVAVNNVYPAMPQYGITQADIIYETVVEGDETRLLAVYPDLYALPDVCSIRSFRYYFPTLAIQYDAIYVHWGEDESAMDYYYSLDMDTYNGIYGGDLFGRDQERLDEGYDLEHTSVFYGSILPEVMHADGVREDLWEGYDEPAFNFRKSAETGTIGGESCTWATVDFGYQWAEFYYDETWKVYFKNNYDEPQIDGWTGQQLYFTNLFLLETSISMREDGYHKDVDWMGGDGAFGYYVSDGEVKEILWSKADEYSKFVFTDMEGNPIEVNCGKSYVALCPYGGVTYGGISGEIIGVENPEETEGGEYVGENDGE